MSLQNWVMIFVALLTWLVIVMQYFSIRDLSIKMEILRQDLTNSNATTTTPHDQLSSCQFRSYETATSHEFESNCFEQRDCEINLSSSQNNSLFSNNSNHINDSIGQYNSCHRSVLPLSGSELCELWTRLQTCRKGPDDSSVDLPPHRQNKLYDRQGLLLVLLFVLGMLFESKYLHKPFFDELDDDETIPKALSSKVRIFLKRRLPISHLSLYSLVFIGSCLNWLGLFDRVWFTTTSIKWLLLHSSALPLALVLDNSLHIYRYLPTSLEEWRRQWRDSSFWLWLLSKVSGCDDLYPFSQTVLSLALAYAVALPYRYVFYYRYSGFSLYGGGAEIFLVNMLIHSSGASLWIHFYTWQCLKSPRSPLVSEWRLGSSPSVIFVQVLFLVLGILRVLWFLFVDWGCQSWGCSVSVLSLPLAWLVVLLLAAVLYACYLQRLEFEKSDRDNFIHTFVRKGREAFSSEEVPPSVPLTDDPIAPLDAQIGTEPVDPTSSGAFSEEAFSEKAAQEAAATLFDRILDRSLLTIMFMSPEEEEFYKKWGSEGVPEAVEGKGGDGSVGSILSKVFSHTAYRIASLLDTEDKSS